MNKEKGLEGAIYKRAVKFLLGKKQQGITKEVLDAYFFEAEKPRPDSLNGIFLALLKAAQNAQRKSNVIGKSLGRGGVEQLGSVLGNFNPNFVKSRYHSWEQLFDTIKRDIKPRGEMAKTSRGIWPGYCQTVIESAGFLSRFSSAEDFYRFVEPLAKSPDERVNLALPLLIDKSIKGFGFALSCDFFRQLGFSQYAKPDVHINKILKGLCVCSTEESDYGVTLALNRIARKAHVTPFAVDKALWLIGSGKFYKHKSSIGKNGQLPRMRDEFLTFAKQLS